MGREAGPDFYTDRYYRTQCGGHELFLESTGRMLDPNRRRALELLAVRPGQRVLDVGCGRGELVVACAERGALAVGVDFSPDALAIASRVTRAGSPAGRTATLAQMEAGLLAFIDESFDAVAMTDIVEHLAPAHLRVVIEQVRRVLRANGKLVIHTGPTQEFMRWGQHVKHWLYRMRGEPAVQRTTWEDEELYAGHCNLQTATTLGAVLNSFRSRRVDYRFTQEEDWFKMVARRLGCARYFAFNLWAVAIK